MDYQASYTPGSWGATADSGSYKSIEERYGLVIKVRSPFNSLHSGLAARREGSELGGSFGHRYNERASERAPSGYITAVETARNFPSFYRESQQIRQALGIAPFVPVTQASAYREEKFVQTGGAGAQVAQGVQTSLIGLPREEERIHGGWAVRQVAEGREGTLFSSAGREAAQNLSSGKDGSQLFTSGRDGSQLFASGRDGSQLFTSGRDGSQLFASGRDGAQILAAGREVPQSLQTGSELPQIQPAGRKEVEILPAGRTGAETIAAGQEGDRTPPVPRAPAGSPQPSTPEVPRIAQVSPSAEERKTPEALGEELPAEELKVEGVGTYQGGLKHGAMSGKGRLLDSEGGLLFEGWFEDNEFEGVGTLFLLPTGSLGAKKEAFEDFDACWDCLERVEGSFHRSLLEGVGLLHFEGGAEFFGEFKTGKAEGFGVWTHGELKLAGIWQNNRFVRRV